MYPDQDADQTRPDKDALRELIECKSTRELALDLNTSQSTIGCHLNKIGKMSKRGVSLLHTLWSHIHSKSSLMVEKWPFFSRISLKATKNVCFRRKVNAESSGFVALHYLSQSLRGFCFRSALCSVWLVLSPNGTVDLPLCLLFIFDPDRRLIANRSHQSTSGWIRLAQLRK